MWHLYGHWCKHNNIVVESLDVHPYLVVVKQWPFFSYPLAWCPKRSVEAEGMNNMQTLYMQIQQK